MFSFDMLKGTKQKNSVEIFFQFPCVLLKILADDNTTSVTQSELEASRSDVSSHIGQHCFVFFVLLVFYCYLEVEKNMNIKSVKLSSLSCILIMKLWDLVGENGL